MQEFVAYSDEELAWLYVEPKFCIKGVGGALIRHAVADLEPTMAIELLEGNTPALELYLSEGFKLIKRIEGRLEGNEDFAAVGLVLTREDTQDGNQ